MRRTIRLGVPDNGKGPHAAALLPCSGEAESDRPAARIEHGQRDGDADGAEVQLAPEADSIAVAIRQEADRFGAAYLVMGAYNHRPAREAIFGGVTRAMLSACSLPLVLGH